MPIPDSQPTAQPLKKSHGAVTVLLDHDDEESGEGNHDIEMTEAGEGEGSGGAIAVSSTMKYQVAAKLIKRALTSRFKARKMATKNLSMLMMNLE